MGDLQTIGRWLIIAGVAVVIVGVTVWLVGRFTHLQNLPGTVKVEIPGLTCVIPLLGSIILSILLTIVINLLLRGTNR